MTRRYEEECSEFRSGTLAGEPAFRCDNKPHLNQAQLEHVAASIAHCPDCLRALIRYMTTGMSEGEKAV